MVAPAQKVGRYRGIVTEADGSIKTFSLTIAPAPAEPSVTIDVSAAWTVDSVFTVADKIVITGGKTIPGSVIVYVKSGTGGQTIRIFNDQALLLDNKTLQADQIVVLYMPRPGKHTIIDQSKNGGGRCDVTITYPTPNKPPDATPIPVQVIRVDASHTMFKPNTITASPLQPIVVTVLDGTHLVTNLIATTDRLGSEIVTTVLDQTT
jgi:hypothetical protein